MDMGKTNIELLIQPPVPEPAASTAARANVVGPGFDDQLRQLQAAAQPSEPSRPAPAGNEGDEPSSPVAVEEPPADTKEASQSPESNEQSEPTRQATDTDASRDSDPVSHDSETAATDDEATEAAAPSSKDGNDTSKDDSAAEQTAVVATNQAQIVLTEAAVAEQVLTASRDDADGADQTAVSRSIKEAAQTTSGGCTQSDAEAPRAGSAPAVAVDDQPSVLAAVAGDTGRKAKPAGRLATGTPDAAESAQPKAVDARRSATDSRHEREAVQGEPEAATEQHNIPRHHDGPTPVAASQDNSKPGVGTRRRPVTAAAAPTEGVQPGVRRAVAQDAAAATPVVIEAATTAGSSEGPDRARPSDDASESPRAEQPSGRMDGVLSAVGRFHRGSPVGRGGRTTVGQELPRVDAARFVGRVARAFETAQQRGGTLHLRLSPPELGSLKLELTVSQGVMTASLETETAAARQALLHHLPALRERLAEQNIRIERFDVDVRQDGGDQSSMGPRQQPQESAFGDASIRLPRRTTAPPQEAPTIVQRVDSTGINVIA